MEINTSVPGTIIEKIFSRGAGRNVKPGDYVWVPVDLVTMRDFGGPNVLQEYQGAFQNQAVFDSSKITITFDLHIPARNEKVARNQKILREFALQHNVRLFDIDTGVGQHILLENGLVKPWDIIVGTDSHMNLLGAVGAAGFGMGTTDIAGAMFKGKLYFRVPGTIKVTIEGTPAPLVSAKDIILHIVKRMGSDGALNKAIEFHGSAVDQMALAARITMTSMVTEMSGDIGFMVPSKDVVHWLASRCKKDIVTIQPDEDAHYEESVNFNIDSLEPQIACPHAPDNVHDVRKIAGKKIDQVFIGSCTNGRFEDLQVVAQILKGRKIKKGLRMIIVPATMEVARQALQAGLYTIFLEAGAVVINPGCALCTTGHPGILAPDEVMVSTSNRNFIGKLGKKAYVYLASPATAAASALMGVITDPREVA